MKPLRVVGTVIGTMAATALAVAGILVPGAVPAAAAGDTLVVNVGTVLRPVTHVAAGGLYALASATVPTAAELPPLHLNQLVQPAPGVQQLGNGATVPTGDALKVAQLAIGAGAQEYVRMPDIYPNFPYRWVSWSDWLSKVDTMVQARLAATGATNLDGWELWNEPDWTWNTAAAGSFDAGWVRTFQAVRALDSVTPIVGPSISVYNHAWMADWLAYAKASNALPNVITWHQLSPGSYANVAANVADFKALEASLGISPLPIAIDEYASTSEVDVPSGALHYIAAFERGGILNASRAYWYESGTVNGLLYNNLPTGTYWLYKWYGDMAGNMVSVTAAGSQDGIASYDSTRKIVNVVVGGDSGTNSVQVNGLAPLGSSVKVVLSYTPDSGRLANVSAPTTVSTTTYTVSNGTVTIPITSQNSSGAYQLLITPAAGPTTSYQQTYEAENATIVNATIEASSAASNGYYVGNINGSGDERSDSFVDFLVNVPTAGTYTLAVRYANGGTANSTQGLAYDGGRWSTVSYPPTGSWTTFATTTAGTLTLRAGSNVIRLAKGSPYFAGGTGYAELDSITVTPS
jgi:Carbohydrate binding module (family 35)